MKKDNSSTKFSIVLPLRNGGEYVKLCVASILEQSYHDFELIILENKSTDGTVEWLKTISDRRVKIISAKKPLSLEDNWSRISSIKTNEFITFIGHDDLFAPNYLDVMFDLIKKHPTATLYQTHFRYINDKGEFLRYCLHLCKIQELHEFIAKQFLRMLDSMGTGYMMRRNDYDKVGGFSKYPNLIFSDYELWVKLIKLGYMVADPAECFSYREHTSASSNTKIGDYQASLIKYLKFLNKEAKDNSLLKDIIARYSDDYLQYMCKNLIYRNISIRRRMENKTAYHIVSDFDALRSDIAVNSKRLVDVNTMLKAGVLIDKWIVGRIAYIVVLRLKYIVKYIL